MRLRIASAILIPKTTAYLNLVTARSAIPDKTQDAQFPSPGTHVYEELRGHLVRPTLTLFLTNGCTTHSYILYEVNDCGASTPRAK